MVLLSFLKKRISLSFLCLSISLIGAAQNTIHIGPCTNSLHEELPDEYKLPYPLLPDSNLEGRDVSFRDSLIVYPVLIVNGIVINDNHTIDLFRNAYDPKRIRFKRLSYKQAKRKRIPCNKDGALIVRVPRYSLTL